MKDTGVSDLLAELEDIDLDSVEDAPDSALASTTLSDSRLIADGSELPPTSIHEDFYKLWRKYRAIVDSYGSPSDAALSKCVESIEHCRQRVVRERLFSVGEALDDIQTDSIKFVLLSHFLSELYTIRNAPHRLKWLKLSDFYAKQFLDFAETWEIMTREESKDYDRGFGDGKDIPLTAVERRTLAVGQRKADIVTDELLARMKHSKKYYAVQCEENNWSLFADDEMDRAYWLQLLHKAIRQSFHTLRQNAEESPLAAISDREDRIKGLKEAEADYAAGGDPLLLAAQRAERKRLEETQRALFAADEAKHAAADDGLPKSSNPWVAVLEADGSVERFDSVDAFGQSLDRRIDDVVALRTDRTKVFRDPNPWTYTASEAAALGLLPEVPKDYDKKQRDRRLKQTLQERHGHRYGRTLADEEIDDGTRLSLHDVDYTMRGGVKTFTMDDMPPDPSEKHDDDLTEAEAEAKRKDDEYWAAWKDDHQKGEGNPYYK